MRHHILKFGRIINLDVASNRSRVVQDNSALP